MLNDGKQEQKSKNQKKKATLEELRPVLKEIGKEITEQDIEEAVREVRARKEKFRMGSKFIGDLLKEKGISEQDVLKDFELSRK